MVEALVGLLLIQPFRMPLCEHKQSHFTEVAAEVVQFDHRADFGLELLSFRGKTGSISESLLFANHFI